MTKRMRVRHEFVEFIPSSLDAGVVYVSIPYATVVHLCCCGCGQEVVTPLTPTDWTVAYDGDAISLDPSIGNWGLPCRSHYWIDRDQVIWAKAWTKSQIDRGRELDRRRKAAHFNLAQQSQAGAMSADGADATAPKRPWWRTVLRRNRGEPSTEDDNA